MSEFLVKAVSQVIPDPEQDRIAAFKKGDVVVVREDDHEWGGKEGPPNFVIVKCPELIWDGDAEEGNETGAYEKKEQWEYLFDFNVIFSNTNQDFHRVDVSSRYPGLVNQAGITQAKVESFLNNWNATIQSTSTNKVTFEFFVYDAAISQGFWDEEYVSQIEFTENSYTKTGGIHNITANLTPLINYLDTIYPNKTREELAIQAMSKFNSMSVRRGATGLVWNGESLTMDVGRDDVRINFLDDVYRKSRSVFTNRRWHFSEADVDTALSMGGVVTLTLAQLGNKLLDKTAE